MANPITAAQIVERIKANVGVPWGLPRSRDGFAAGAPDTAITGIVTTFAPTLDVLRRAVASGKNLIVSREFPFWNRFPTRKDSPVFTSETYRLKRDFLAKHALVIWRFTDHWQARPEDGQLRALAQALGWDSHHIATGPPGAAPYAPGQNYFRLPGSTLEALVQTVQDRLKIRAVRVLGDPRTPVSKVALTHGLIRVPELQKILKEPALDAVLIGEPVEWEASPYFLDLLAAGQQKGLIVLGHEASEEPGSGEVAAWLKTFLPEIPIEWIPAGEPFWVLDGGPHAPREEPAPRGA